MMQHRTRILNEHAAEAERRRRDKSRCIAAENHSAAAAAAQRRRRDKPAEAAPMDLSHVAPVRVEASRDEVRAQAVDYREDLDVQVARNRVRC